MGNMSKAVDDRVGTRARIPAVIMAGDQYWQFCEESRLHHVDARAHATWPASCRSRGKHRGDIICASSYFEVATAEETVEPCWCGLPLSDHALTYVGLRP